MASKLLNEVSQARLCLLKDASKQRYDEELRKRLDPKAAFQIETKPESAGKTRPSAKKVDAAGSVPLWKKPAVIGGAAAALVVAASAILMLTSSRGNHPPRGTDRVSDSLPKASQPAEGAQATASGRKEVPPVPARREDTTTAAAGPAVDLLKRVQPPQHAVKGEVLREPDGAVFLADKLSEMRLPLSGAIPEDYRLTFTAERPGGTDSLFVIFPCGGRMTLLILDGWSGSASGICIDGRMPDNNCTTHRGTVLNSTRPNDISIEVHPGTIRVACNGVVVVDWSGNPERLYVDSIYTGHPGKDEFFVATGLFPYRFRRIELTPLRPAAPRKPAEITQPVDLLRDVDLAKDTFAGKWMRDNSGLHSVGSGHAGIQLGQDFPEEYTLVVRTRRPLEQNGEPTLILGFPAGESLAEFVFDNGGCCGLDILDARRWHQSVTRIPGIQLKGGLEHEVRITVLKRRIALDIDGRRLLDWAGDFHRLSVPGEWVGPRSRALSVGTDIEYTITAARLEPPQKLPQPPKDITAPVDLLKQIDDSRDAYWGVWTLDRGALQSDSTELARLALPVQVPDEYTLTFDVTKLPAGEDDSLKIGLPMGEHFVQLALDSYRSSKSGLELDDDEVVGNSTLREGRLFEPGKQRTVVCRVSRTGIQVECDGKPLIDWRGNPCRRFVYPVQATPLYRHPYLATWRTSYRFSRIELGPNPSPPPAPERPRVASGGNLVRAILPDLDSWRGDWRISDGSLISPSLHGGRLVLPVKPPSRYTLSMLVERETSVSDFLISLPIGNRVATVMLDGYQSRHSGFDTLDRQRPDRNPTRHDGPVLRVGKTVQLDCIVTPESVRVLADEAPVFNWQGDPRRLDISPIFLKEPLDLEDQARISIGTWESRFRISQIVLNTNVNEKTPPPRLMHTSTARPLTATKSAIEKNGAATGTAGPGVLNQKEPIPDQASVSAAEARVRKMFDDDIRRAKSAAAQSALAAKMLEQADDRKADLATVYAMQTAASELAADAGNVVLALEAVDQLTATFAADSRALKESTLERAAKGAKNSTQRKAVADAALELANAAADEDQFDSAERLSKIAILAARGASDPALPKRVAARAKEIEEQHKAYRSLQADLATLESMPEDADANLRVGRYECFAKQDWESGLPHLAKGSDPGLRELARRELAKPGEAKEKLALADGWDELASHDKSPSRPALEDHAEEWYRQILDELSGIDKLRVEKRLAVAETQKTKQAAKSGPSIRSLRPGLVGEYFSDIEFKNRVLVRIDETIDFDWGGGSPDDLVPVDRFGIRWHGYLRAPGPGKYTLVLSCDNGCRLTLDDKTIFDALGILSTHRLTAEVELTDKPHKLRVEFNEGDVTAACKLYWLREGKDGFAEQPISPLCLYHTREQEKLNTAGK